MRITPSDDGIEARPSSSLHRFGDASAVGVIARDGGVGLDDVDRRAASPDGVDLAEEGGELVVGYAARRIHGHRELVPALHFRTRHRAVALRATADRVPDEGPPTLRDEQAKQSSPREFGGLPQRGERRHERRGQMAPSALPGAPRGGNEEALDVGIQDREHSRGEPREVTPSTMGPLAEPVTHAPLGGWHPSAPSFLAEEREELLVVGVGALLAREPGEVLDAKCVREVRRVDELVDDEVARHPPHVELLAPLRPKRVTEREVHQLVSKRRQALLVGRCVPAFGIHLEEDLPRGRSEPNQAREILGGLVHADDQVPIVRLTQEERARGAVEAGAPVAHVRFREEREGVGRVSGPRGASRPQASRAAP